MQLSLHLTRFCVPVAVVALAFSCPAFAQKPGTTKPVQSEAPKIPPPPKPPALVDPAGPAISLQTSEAVFDIAVALNACGYDNGLADSDPLREHIREQVNQATQQSADAREARFHLCEFINQHRLAEAGRDLAQYISLALYVTPPPELAPSVE